MIKKKSSLVFSCCALLILMACSHKNEQADVIVHNAKIISLDENNSIYEAMAIKDGKIIELGPERQIMNKFRADVYFDAEKKTIYPGFIDAHAHILNYGLSLIYADLLNTKSFDDVLEKVKQHAKQHPELNVIIGRGWDQNDWANTDFPDNKKLSELFKDKPVLLYRIDGHAAIANDYLLQLAGITTQSKLSGGEYMVNENRLTGVLIDNAIDSVKKVLPEPDDAMLEKAFVLANEKLLQFGLTTIDDAGMERNEVEKLKSLMDEGKFKLRVYAMIIANWENLNYYTVEGPYKDDQLSIRSFKFLADGALGSRGACLKSPYSDVHSKAHYGAMLYDYDFLKRSAQLLYESGFQMNTHCIGDSANKALLDIYATTLGDMNDKRWRIEHAQIVDPSDFNYFKKYSIIPSVQPTHATSDREWAEHRVGAERIKGAYAYKTLLQLNGWMPLGTDFPVENPNPIYTFYAAVFRKDSKGNPADGFMKEQALTRIEALKGMTIWAAKSNFEEKEKGTLEKGKFADFVVLNQDLLEIPEQEILRTYVVATWINGEQVYSIK